MPTYVILYTFTQKGRQSIKSTVNRATQARRENERRGFKVIGTWWTQGQYDLITVVDAPSESAMMGALFNVAEAGNVSSVSMRAFTETEMRRAFSAASDTAARKRTTTRKRTTKRPAGRTAKRTATSARRSAASRAKTARQSAASRTKGARKRAPAGKRPARKTARRR